MNILMADASDVTFYGNAADHDGAVYHPLAYWGGFSSCLHHGRTTFCGRIYRSSRRQPTKAPQYHCTTATPQLVVKRKRAPA